MRGVTAVTLPLRGLVSCRRCVTGSTSAQPSELVRLSYYIVFWELCLVLFFNQCDWIIASYHIIVLHCLEMS